ncbi:MAG: hypothetical protein B7Z08_07860 [Sphingomonadales bacterium 32-68-7]|nr:MAG: hypothetical protein B7Z33_01955 [Sphingomonadales bacterium 12-68-11]OYX08877.1 MAG: hypothetical protein B7Z08_07860 [Sphingomonadales bacterium 32-68-7]
MESRLPAHLEVAGMIRAVQAAGGFATVIAKGDREAGTILAICCVNGAGAAAYERMPQADGSRKWTLTRKQSIEENREFWEYCDRRSKQDNDLWIVELDIANGERFIDDTLISR